MSVRRSPDIEAGAIDLLGKLDRLRIELVELAYALETRGQRDAADVAITTSARLGELCEERPPEE